MHIIFSPSILNQPASRAQQLGGSGIISRTAVRISMVVILLSCAGVALPYASAQRVDNRRLIWTGSHGTDWTSASWRTTGSFLNYANASAATWISGGTSGTPAVPSLPFLAGDSIVFDSVGDNPASRTINVAPEGVAVSDIVVSGAGNYTFTGGGITSDGNSVRAETYQLNGVGATPGGRLVKIGSGTLTLSNTVANNFKGGILIAQGGLTVTNTAALGNNNISIIFTGNPADNILPAIVTNAAGELLRAGNAQAGPIALNIPASAAGLDITGDIYLHNGTIKLDIEGDTAISGRLYGVSNNYGATGGCFVKTGTGTLTLTGARNWFYSTSTIAAGKLVVTNVGGIGSGNMFVAPSGTLVFQGIRGATFPMLFIGKGRVEVVDSDITMNWHNGVLIGATASNDIGTLIVTASSRLNALASGTLAGVLGGPNVNVVVGDCSTLELGREGISNRSVAGTLPPINYDIVAKNLTLSGSSMLLFQPNASLKISDSISISPDSKITFTGGGISRLNHGAGPAPDATAYLVPNGMSLDIAANGNQLQYVVVNQGANPLKDFAMTLSAIDAAMDTVSSRFDEEFLIPVATPRVAKGRRWINSAWARYFSSNLDYDSTSSTLPGHHGRIDGLLVGFDGSLRQRILVGFYGSIVENNLDTTNNSNLRSKQRTLGIYGAQRFKNAYLNASLSMGKAETQAWRHEDSGQTRGDWNNNYYCGGIEAGAVIRLWKNGFIKPCIGIRYTRVEMSGFEERGLCPMKLEDFSDALAQLFGGVQASYKFKIFGCNASADLTLGGKHATRTPRETITTAYISAPDIPITLQSGDYYKDALLVSIGLRMAFTRYIFSGISLEREDGGGRTRDTAGVTLGICW